MNKNGPSILNINEINFEKVRIKFMKINSYMLTLISIILFFHHIYLIFAMNIRFYLFDFFMAILKSILTLIFAFIIFKLKKNESKHAYDYFSMVMCIFIIIYIVGVIERLVKSKSFPLLPHNSKYYYFIVGCLYYPFFISLWILIKSKKKKIFLLIFNQVYILIRTVIFEKISSLDVILSTFWILMIFIIFYQIWTLLEFYNLSITKNFTQIIEQEKEWKNLINNLPNAISIINKKNNNILYSNNILKSFFKLKLNSSEILVDSFEKLEEELGNMTVYENSEKLLEKVSLSKILEFIKEKYKNANTKNQIVLNYQLILDENNSIMEIREIELKIMVDFIFSDEEAFILIFEDVTLKNLIRRFKESDEFKTRVLNSFSHELKTPLNGAISMLENSLLLIKNNEENNIKIETFKEIYYKIEMSYNNIMILSSTLDCFVDYSHIMINNLAINIVKTKIKFLINDAINIFKFQSNFKKLKISVEYSNDLPKSIFTDKNRLNQILINILSNAIKFTFKGTINIKVKQLRDSEIEFSVKDSGIGMDETKLKNLEEYLYNNDLKIQNLQLNSTGAGLGLLFSSKLLKYLSKGKDGKFKIESKKDFGSCFSFKIENKNNEFIYYGKDLNIQEESVFSESSENFHFIPKILSQKKKCFNRVVLIVDDEPFNLLALEFMLNELKFKAIKAQNGLEALNYFKNCHCKHCNFSKCSGICLIFMDYQMPLMNGVESTEKIKKFLKEKGKNDVDIIGCSAFNGETEVKKCLKSGMSDFIVKPLNISFLNNILKKFLKI